MSSSITFVGAVPVNAFKTLEGVDKVEALPNGHTLRLEVQGGLDGVIKAAAQYPIATLTSQEPSLEEVFLRYYGTTTWPQGGEPCGLVASF